MNAPYAPPGNGRSKDGAVQAMIVLGAAVVIAAIVLWARGRHASPPPAPAAPVAAASEMVLAGPGARFVWRRDPRADVYRIEAYDHSNRLLAAAVLRDTSFLANVLLPDSAHAGTWRVVVVTAGGTELTSGAPTPFRRE